MTALIIGAGGFVGKYLIDELSDENKWRVVATKLPQEQILADNCEIRDLNILNEDEILNLLTDVKPDYIFHLAAQSSVALSWKKPALTVDINIKGCVNLLESVRKSNLSPRVLLIGSSEEYGFSANTDCAVSEDVMPQPANVYAITKYTQNMLGTLYCKSYGIDIISVRAFNHIGPGQSPQFVVSDFCKQVADIEHGKQQPVIYVGNLEAKRDFTDVRDIVRAYAQLALKGKSGETYNVGSGKAVSIQTVLDTIIEQSTADIRVDVDAEKLRPIDVPVIKADITKLQSDTGWKPQYSLEKTILDILVDYRMHIAKL